ncbi:hypothetical protein HJD18_04635 [Thermoleophilia bacterium SCSIO 60948]|nr:hypothetical protein HJD18_04635 [Thermoleophilia bacterium SCSIO 60948]
MAREAAELLRELVAAGEEIPYDVRGSEDGQPMARFEPLTARYVRDHAEQLHGLESFGVACATVEAASMAGPYLEEMGIAAPSESRRRAELAGIVFLCRLWADSTDFSLDHDRLSTALDEVERSASPSGEEIDVVVPLRGLVMSSARLDLPMASIVRADTVDAPADASAIEGMGASPWEPVFLAVARVSPYEDGEGPVDVGARAVESLRGLVTTLRLFAPGNVALGPHAWIRAAGDRWRRISTGSGRPRRGGYRLADTDVSNLKGFARALASRGTDSRGGGVFGRAISRFEAGLERPLAVEGLSDHLLALRFVLEGGGPAQLGVPMRVAALCAEPGERDAVRATVERATAIERELWSGERSEDATPVEIAAELEELCRAILKDAVCGHLGTDLRATADEILLADGLTAGEGSVEGRGETAEWQLGDEEPTPHRSLADNLDAELPDIEAQWASVDEIEARERLERLIGLSTDDAVAEQDAPAAEPHPTEEASIVEADDAAELAEREAIAELPTEAYTIPFDGPQDELGFDVDSAFEFPESSAPSVEAIHGPEAGASPFEAETEPETEGELRAAFDADAEIDAEAGAGGTEEPATIDLFRASRERLTALDHLHEPDPEPTGAVEPSAEADVTEQGEMAPVTELWYDRTAQTEVEVDTEPEPEPEPEPERLVYPDHVSALSEPTISPALHDGSSPVYELIERTRAERQERNDRVAALFPRPEECDWNVRELGYRR